MLKRIVLSIAMCSTSTASALAQANANYDPALLQAAHSVDTPQKMAGVIRDNYHVNVSKTWPTNFPVPAYNSNVLKTSFTNSTQGQPTAGAVLITQDQPLQVFNFYQAACIRANWRVRVPTAKSLSNVKANANGDLYVLAADQGKQSMFLTCTRHRKSNGTILSITWQKNP